VTCNRLGGPKCGSLILRCFRFIICVATALLLAGCGDRPGALVRGILVTRYIDSLVERWAPVHHQDVDTDGTWSLSGGSDFITAIDFDGDWNTADNWETIPSSFGHEAVAHAYYSVVLTESHAFIVYSFYHPRDWDDMGIGAASHENDVEGLLAVVELPGRVGSVGFDYGDMGELKAIVTVFHHDFYSYNNRIVPSAEQFRARDEDIDGEIHFEEYDGDKHPVTAQEAEGHGLKAWPQVRIEGGDGIVYYPVASGAQEPEGPNDRHAEYNLVDVFAEDGLWERRYDPDTFASFGVFLGDTHGQNKANAPWNWDDIGGLGTSPDSVEAGVIATDPVKLVKSYFSNLGSFSDSYILNPYQGIVLGSP